MGSILSTPEDISLDQNTYRILSYNVEWGFLNVPGDIDSDSCGHSIPHSSKAQQTHLTLISKNIGIVNPDICFLQEMGSLDAVKFISDQLKLSDSLLLFNNNIEINSDFYDIVSNRVEFDLNSQKLRILNRGNIQFK